jgi:hypothetical protein
VYDPEKQDMVVFYEDIENKGVAIDIRLSRDGVYRFDLLNDTDSVISQWGYTFVTEKLESYIKEGVLRYRGETPCHDCNSYDFCNLLTIMQSYYAIMFTFKDDEKDYYESDLSTLNLIPEWVQNAGKLIAYAALYLPK